MFRTAICLLSCAAVGAVLFLEPSVADGQPQKNQMVKGTIKKVDTSKDVLIINQKIKNDVVDRELSILNTTTFEITGKGGKQEATGSAGLKLLEGKEGSQVNIRCDKDVNVLSVKVMVK